MKTIKTPERLIRKWRKEISAVVGDDRTQEGYLRLAEEGQSITKAKWLRAARALPVPTSRYHEVPLGGREPVQPETGPTIITDLSWP